MTAAAPRILDAEVVIAAGPACGRSGTIAALEEASHLLAALRLGWGMAETRGRNRPDGPLGADTRMPDHRDHALPLRIERSPDELRIEAQSLVAALAKELHVDDCEAGPGFGAALDDQAKLLYHLRAPKASNALRDARDLLQDPGTGPPGTAPAVQAAAATLQAGLAAQQAVIHLRRHAVTAAERAVIAAQLQVARAAGQPAEAEAAAARAVGLAEAAVQREHAALAGEMTGLTALRQVIDTLQEASDTSPQAAVAAGLAAIASGRQHITTAAQQAWADLAELIWRFDAYVQDGLAAASETVAIGYQLGRGLAETYWALDPGLPDGSTGWSFLLGGERCSELTRLTGRLAAYLNEYTAPAIAGSIEVWKSVASTKDWRGDGATAGPALYRQIRRWYELITLGQDPTTLIKPGDIIRNYRAAGRAIKFFWPQLAALAVGLGFLTALIVFVGAGGSAVQKTFSGILAGVGLSLAGITGTLKNSGQAMLKRLRQDAYTDLVAIAVQTAPPPPRKSDIRKAIAQRKLTPSTPN